jgi:hypothetical protein
VKDVAAANAADWAESDVEMDMMRRLFALTGLVFYGSLDRVTRTLFTDLDYPEVDDPLAS